MPQTKIDKRCFSQPKKCDVPAPNFVTTFEIKDESSPESSPPFNGFFRSGQPAKSGVSQATCNGRTTKDNVTYSALSVLSNDSNQEDKTSERDLDLDPSKLIDENVNFGNKNKCGRKSTLFSDSLLNSLTSEPLKENGMKIISDSVAQVSEDFSDLLSSISLPDHESKEGSKLHLSDFEVSDKHVALGNAIPNNSDIMKPNGFTTQNNSTLSDILSSISFDELDSSQTGNNLSTNPNQCFKENPIPVLNYLDPEFSKLNSSNNIFKQNDLESNNGTLSDILSSISFDKIDTSVQTGFTSSSSSSLSSEDIKIPISNELNPDFATLNSHTTDNTSKLNASSLESNGNLSDMLSSIVFPENDNAANNGLKSASLFSPKPSQGFESDSLFNLLDLSSELLKSDDKVKLSTDKPIDGDIFNILSIENDTSNNIQNNLFNKSLDDGKTMATSSINTPKTSNHMQDEKNREFSFFSVSPDNVFSAMLSNITNTSDSQDKNNDEHLSEISMLDLLKSVNTDSSGSLSEYLKTPSENKEIKTGKQAVNTVLDELLNIDLSTCIKTSDNPLNTLNNELPVNKVYIDEKDNEEIKLEALLKPVFDNVDSSYPKPPRMNLNQSLFAKSLSCKPKKNRILLQKVALIKSELYERYFKHSISDVGKSKMDKNIWIKDDDTSKEMVVCKTNDCMIRFKGRRLCPQEVH